MFLTKADHENSAESEKLAEQLAKKMRVKTGSLLQHFKDYYMSDECSRLRGEPNHQANVLKEYNLYMDKYQEKLKELSEKIELVRELKEQKGQLNGVVLGASNESQNWKNMAETQRKKNYDLGKKCAQTSRKLKKEITRKDELGKVLAKTEKRAAQNEKFRLHAEAAIESASTYLVLSEFNVLILYLTFI